MKELGAFHETLIPMLVDALDAKVYLEIGTGRNETISKIGCALKFGVDPNAIDCPGATMFRMTSKEWLPQAGNWAPYDFVFIDADHSLESARADLLGIIPHVSNEGMIAVHDTNPKDKASTDPSLCGDSWKLAMELSSIVNLESVTLNYHPGLTLVRKRLTWGPSA